MSASVRHGFEELRPANRHEKQSLAATDTNHGRLPWLMDFT
ncbi:MAG: hypothetical protein OXE41_12360 [Gammaproteobacteria bacterium]|nr:hypothetical protein [Gammaproteobacteria bacterium]